MANDTAQRKVEDATPDNKEQAAEHAGRAGFVAKGVLYATIGAIAASIGFAAGGESASQTGAIRTLADTAWGTVILWALVLGLAGYAALMTYYLIEDPDPKDGMSGVAHRISYALRALTYGGLAVFTTTVLVGGGSSGGGGGEQQLTGMVLGWPGGQVIVGIVALITFGVAAVQLKKGVSGEFMELVQGVDSRVRRQVRWTGVVGHVTRAVVFGAIGVTLSQAALASDSSEAGGVDKALQEIAGLPYGSILLSVVAAGLITYGAFCLAVGRWGSLR